MTWETPAFEEIEMNAEIGSYQGDYDDRDYDGL
jgi:coenzyme PQQ precursor peptide PqqA